MRPNSVVISGAIQGIGFEIGKYFLTHSKYHLCIIDNQEHVDNIEFLKIKFPNRFTIFSADLSSAIETETVAAKIINESLPMILVNNLGSRDKTSLGGETGISFSNTLNTIVVSNFLLSRSFLNNANLEKITKFRIVNIGSILADFVGPQSPSYHAAKGTLQSLNRYFSIEGKRLVPDFSVILLQLGFVLQNRYQPKFNSNDNSDFQSSVRHYLGSPHVISDEEIAAMVFQLSTGDATRLLNGNVIDLDNGSKNSEHLNLLQTYNIKNE